MRIFLGGIHSIRCYSTHKRRVVVTGVGLVSCLGLGTERVWGRLLLGHCGLDKVQGKGYENIPCQVVGSVPKGHEDDQLFVAKEHDRGVSMATTFAFAAAEEALTQASWKPNKEVSRRRTGVCIGSGMVDLELICDAGGHLRRGMYRKISPWFVPEILVNIAAGHISLKYGFKGPNHSVSTACTTGLHAIGDATRFIKYNDADVMLAGGTEACIGPIAMAGFCRMRALSTSFNHCPTEASRPFDSRRDGFVMSEGAGLLVLEDLSHALERGASILGEIIGYGLSADAHHITTPPPTGDGAFWCMKNAVVDAGLVPADVGHVNAHATSTPAGDIAESKAILRLLGAGTNVTSVKGALGHLLGATGSVEAILALKSCQTGLIPPTINLCHPDTRCDLDYVTGSPRPWPHSGDRRRVALTNSFGFGGTNACVCLAEFRP